MAYTKVNWQNGATALSAENFNHMDQGIADAHDDIAAANEDINDVITELHEDYAKKSTMYGNKFDTMITIPRSLIDNNKTATFNYIFPDDGYLRLYNNIDDTLAVTGLSGFGIYDGSGANYMPIGDRKFGNYDNMIIFVKKGMALRGAIAFATASYQSAFVTCFHPLKLRTE